MNCIMTAQDPDEKRYHNGHDILVCCTILDIDPDAVFKRVNIECATERVGSLALTARQTACILAAMMEEYGRDDFHIKLAEGHAKALYTMPMSAFIVSRNIREGLRRLVNIKHTTQPANWKISDAKGGFHVSISEQTPDFPVTAYYGLISFVWVILCCRNYTLKEIRPKRVILSGVVPLQDRAEELIGCRIEIGSCNLMEIDHETGQIPFLVSDKLFSMGVSHGRQNIQGRGKLSDSDTFVEQTTEKISRLLPSGRVTAGRIAEDFLMSQRTFERRLREEGTSFSKLINLVRHDLAQQYLANGYLSVTEISFMLGFEEPNSFIRAFKRWENVSPAQFRQKIVTE